MSGQDRRLMVEMRDLLSRLCDDAITEIEVARLEQLLDEDLEAQTAYLAYMRMHSDLRLEMLSQAASARTAEPDERLTELFAGEMRASGQEVESQAATEASTSMKLCDLETPTSTLDCEDHAGSPVLGFMGGTITWAGQHMPLIALLTVVTAVSGAVVWEVLRGPSTHGDQDRPVAREQGNMSSERDNDRANSVVATIVRKVDCVWEDSKWEVGASADIKSGQTIRLSQGVMEIEFTGGAVVTLQGPVRLAIESSERAYLYLGMLSARVPPQARGFTIGTPSGQVIDLGTEFGLSVDEAGVADVHVFKGEVVVEPSDPQQQAARPGVHLREKAAARFAGVASERSAIHYDADRFLRLDDGEFSDDYVIPRLPVTHHLALWLAADGLLNTNRDEHVAIWGDIVVDGNRAAHHAWQVNEKRRPLLVQNAIGNKPAIRFNGRTTSLVTRPMSTGNDQTLFVVGSIELPFGRPDSNQGTQIINYNGPPNLVLHVNGRDSQRLEGRVYDGFFNGQHISVGQTVSSRFDTAQPFLVTYRYAYSENRAQLFLNGTLQETTTAPVAAAVTSPRFIGSHWGNKAFFHGDIAEIVIFDCALSDIELDAVQRYLIEKYELLGSPQQPLGPLAGYPRPSHKSPE